MHPAINSLVPPSQKRPGIYSGGILQIHVGRMCDLSCHSCSQGSNLAGRPTVMTPEQFRTAVESLDGYFGIIGCFGGNPCVSPHFEAYCEILRELVPYSRRGLWSNSLRSKGAAARATFNPAVSNLNTHLSRDAYDEFCRDWPESRPFLKGVDVDSRHSSPWVSMVDLGIPEEERWRLIADCDIAKWWSSMICVVRGQLRAFLCEIAGAAAMLHSDNPDWAGTGKPMPDTGLKVVPGWWRQPLESFAHQVETHCHHCSVPLRRPGQLAIGGTQEEFSETHRFIARPKSKSRAVAFVGADSIGVISRPERPATQYLPGTTPGYREPTP